MKKLLAATTAVGAMTFASPAFAVTNGVLSGSTTIAYSCDMTLPSNITLSASGDTASGTDSIFLNQNGDTTYTLDPLTVNSPNGTDILGTVTVLDSESATIVSNSSDTNPASGNVTGLSEQTGTVSITIQELTAGALAQGTYQVLSGITCSQAI